MTTQKQSPLVVTSIVGIIGMALSGLWSGAGKIEAYIGSLPVKGAQSAPAPAAATSATAGSLAVLYPLYVESKQKVERLPRSPVESSKLIDGSFARSATTAVAGGAAPNLPVPQPVALPDYFNMLGRAIRVEAITGNGAVLNGRFYEVGQAVTAFAYPGKKDQKMTTPVLSKITDGAVVVAEAPGEGSRSISILAR